MDDKQKIRIWVKEERKKLDIQALSNKLVKKIQALDEYKHAKNVMLFYPLKYEVNLLSLMNDDTKNFFLPKIFGEDILCCPYSQGDDLYESCFKTKEPISKPLEKTIIDLIILPALAVDKNRYRLGYGRGFYDRFLVEINAIKIVCIPETFVLESVYPEAHDMKVDKIITA